MLNRVFIATQSAFRMLLTVSRAVTHLPSFVCGMLFVVFLMGLAFWSFGNSSSDFIAKWIKDEFFKEQQAQDYVKQFQDLTIGSVQRALGENKVDYTFDGYQAFASEPGTVWVDSTGNERPAVNLYDPNYDKQGSIFDQDLAKGLELNRQIMQVEQEIKDSLAQARAQSSEHTSSDNPLLQRFDFIEASEKKRLEDIESMHKQGSVGADAQQVLLKDPQVIGFFKQLTLALSKIFGIEKELYAEQGLSMLSLKSDINADNKANTLERTELLNKLNTALQTTGGTQNKQHQAANLHHNFVFKRAGCLNLEVLSIADGGLNNHTIMGQSKIQGADFIFRTINDFAFSVLQQHGDKNEQDAVALHATAHSTVAKHTTALSPVAQHVAAQDTVDLSTAAIGTAAHNAAAQNTAAKAESYTFGSKKSKEVSWDKILEDWSLDTSDSTKAIGVWSLAKSTSLSDFVASWFFSNSEQSRSSQESQEEETLVWEDPQLIAAFEQISKVINTPQTNSQQIKSNSPAMTTPQSAQPQSEQNQTEQFTPSQSSTVHPQPAAPSEVNPNRVNAAAELVRQKLIEHSQDNLNRLEWMESELSRTTAPKKAEQKPEMGLQWGSAAANAVTVLGKAYPKDESERIISLYLDSDIEVSASRKLIGLPEHQMVSDYTKQFIAPTYPDLMRSNSKQLSYKHLALQQKLIREHLCKHGICKKDYTDAPQLYQKLYSQAFSLWYNKYYQDKTKMLNNRLILQNSTVKEFFPVFQEFNKNVSDSLAEAVQGYSETTAKEKLNLFNLSNNIADNNKQERRINLTVSLGKFLSFKESSDNVMTGGIVTKVTFNFKEGSKDGQPQENGVNIQYSDQKSNTNENLDFDQTNVVTGTVRNNLDNNQSTTPQQNSNIQPQSTDIAKAQDDGEFTLPPFVDDSAFDKMIAEQQEQEKEIEEAASEQQLSSAISEEESQQEEAGASLEDILKFKPQGKQSQAQAKQVRSGQGKQGMDLRAKEGGVLWPLAPSTRAAQSRIGIGKQKTEPPDSNNRPSPRIKADWDA